MTDAGAAATRRSPLSRLRRRMGTQQAGLSGRSARDPSTLAWSLRQVAQLAAKPRLRLLFPHHVQAERLLAVLLDRQRHRAVRALRLLRQQGDPGGVHRRAGRARVRQGRASWSAACSTRCSTSCRALAGTVVDRYGFKKSLLACFSIFCIGYFLIGLGGLPAGKPLVRRAGRRALHGVRAGGHGDRRLADQAVDRRHGGADDHDRDQGARLLDLLHAREPRRRDRADPRARRCARTSASPTCS